MSDGQYPANDLPGQIVDEIWDQLGEEMKMDNESVIWRTWAQGILMFYMNTLGDEYRPIKMATNLKPEAQAFGVAQCSMHHASWMLREMDAFIAENEEGKFYRWLGFVQGVFSCCGVFTIDEMREHNRRN